MSEKKTSPLKAIRDKNQLSQQQVAHLLGISVKTLHTYEHGRGLPEKERKYISLVQRELDAGGMASTVTEPAAAYPSLEARLADVERRLRLLELIVTKP